jgi:hypothetical protein
VVTDRPALSSIEAAEPVNAPDERTTIEGIAIVPSSVRPDRDESDSPSSVGVSKSDERVERLLEEVFLLMRERHRLRQIATESQRRGNELLTEARRAKMLVRAFLHAHDDVRDDALTALKGWADSPL